MFGKLYLLGLGIMLFVIGTGLGFASGIATESCARIEAMPKGFDVAFNPCTVFQALPVVALLMQLLGLAFVAAAIFLLVKAARPLKCPRCKAKVAEKSAYCPKCGAKLPGLPSRQ